MTGMSADAGMPANTERTRVLSGIQPTADSFQLGNYLGALRQWVAMQDEFEAFYCVVDQHAITVPGEPEELQRRTLSSLAQLLAAGVDPERSTIFVQSHVPGHSQLAWILACLTGYGEAQRMTQFKDKSARGETGSATLGLFTYPVLMAADILVYQAGRVPVGDDQRQHLELARTLAERFNSRYGTTFLVPEALVPADVSRIVDLQNPMAKMSKSFPAGCVFLLDDARRIEKMIKSAVTDSVGRVRFDPETQPGVSNLLSILSGFTGESIPVLEKRYEGSMYGPLKKDVAAVVVEFASQYRSRTEAFLSDRGELDRLMAAGAARAREVASATLVDVYERVGFVPLPPVPAPAPA